MIVFTCPECQTKISAKPQTAGQRRSCPRCDKAITIPRNSKSSNPRQLGSYRLLKKLGEGGMGKVYLAEDIKLQRQVALKVMLPHLATNLKNRERFLREARVAASLNHDHIVTIHQVDEDRGMPYFVMPLLQGESLHDRLQREERLPIYEVARIGKEIAEGLHAAHQQGLVHRDIKPANVWLEEGTNRVKILDFGLAKLLSSEDQLTNTGAMIGTPSYMAPEQAQSGNFNDRCDLFSLGCLLYRISTGELPFQADGVLALLYTMAHHDPTAPRERNSNIPQSLEQLILQLMAKRPEDRPANAQVVVAQLQVIEEQASASVDLNGPGISETLLAPTPQGDSKRFPTFTMLLGGGLLVVILLAMILFSGGDASLSGDGPSGTTELTSTKPPNTSRAEKIHILSLPAGVKLEMVRVPKGTFWMSENNKNAQRQVEIKEEFYIGKYEVTQAQWQAVMGNNPSAFSRTGEKKEEVKNINDVDLGLFPVDHVSWEDCQAFLNKLNEINANSEWVYRLPTGAEWEYSCRGAANSKEKCSFHFYLATPMNALSSTQANIHPDNSDGNIPENPFLNRTARVGSYTPNTLGIYDMHGNLWEWCQDQQDLNKLLRGGCWTNGGEQCRAGNRVWNKSFRNNTIGFRLACSAVKK